MNDVITACPFSGAKAKKNTDFQTDTVYINSDACGNFALSENLFLEFKRKTFPKQGLINCAHRCREITAANTQNIPYWVLREDAEADSNVLKDNSSHTICIFEDYLEKFVDHSTKPFELLNSFATRIKNDSPYSKFKVELTDQIRAKICDAEELTHLIGFLNEEKYLKLHLPPGQFSGLSQIVGAIFDLDIQLTVRGWDEITRRNLASLPKSKKAFIATQFSWPVEDDLRVQAIDAIKKACKSSGFDADIVSQNHTGFVTDRIIAEIKQSRFVVAELSYNNRGVYFEAGLARGLGIPVFHVIRDDHVSGNDADGKKVHFDIQQIRYLKWKTPEELHSDLKVWIEATLK